MGNGDAKFRGLALADPVTLVPQIVPGQYGYWVIYSPLATPPNKISVYPGDTVRFGMGFQHRGAGTSYTLYCSLGVRRLSIFDEDPRITRSFSKSVPEHADWTDVSVYGDIPIPSDYDGFGWKDAYAKVMIGGSDKVLSPEYDDAVQILAREAYFQDMAITSFEKV
jgi:hypothetical protein